MDAARVLSKGDKIRILNDHARTTFTGCRVMITAHIAGLDPKIKAKVLLAARTFKRFDDDNDPYDEHDLFFFDCEGDRYFAKMDYYDRQMEYGSDDPSDPLKTTRVLTIGHHSDY